MTKDQGETTVRSGALEALARDEMPTRPSIGVVPLPGLDPERDGAEAPRSEEALPNRYEVRERDDGQVLQCTEAPGVAVSIDRRHQFSEADARKLGERVILLDGAGQFAPLIDNTQRLYNLDHHQDCLRAFTLATCEQALIVVLRGLELDRGDWMIYANEPDLDTVFAVWILLNYRRVRELTTAQRDAILPLIHLEGAIDANGYEVAEHSGLPQALLAAEKARLDRLHETELELKSSGDWGEADLAEYARAMLFEIDQLVYRAEDFTDFAKVEEVYTHVDVGEGRVAVVCRDVSGIYEVERRLKSTWGDRLGLIALERAEGQYTLRRTASLAAIDLEQAYGKLNLLDPRVDGRPPEKRWGGSDEIGGSPRPDGTALTPDEIAKILKMTYKRIRPAEHFQRYATAAMWAVLLVLAAGVAVISWRVFLEPEASAISAAAELALAAAVIGLGAWLLTRKLSRGWTWLFGWRRPAGRDWNLLVPVVLAAAAGGGVWMPRRLATDPESLAALAGSMVFAALALELCFRGLVHGLLVLDSPVQTVGSRWFVSGPALASGLLFALATAVVSKVWVAESPLDLPALARLGSTGGAALVAGIALGMVRERSLSVWPAVAAAVAGGAVRVGLEIWNGG